MDYFVYILGPQDEGKADQLKGDAGALAMATKAAAGMAQDAAGFDFIDPKAKKLDDEKSVALTGKTVREMKFVTTIIKEGDQKLLQHTMTIKGVLEVSNTLFGMGTTIAKKKDTSRIWKWANVPMGAQGDKAADYYRDVVATVYSSKQSQYRAIVLKKAFVGNYEEEFDKNGEGHFTLVVNKIITMPAANEEAGIKSEGPTFKQNFTSVSGDISKAAKSAKKNLDKGVKVAETFIGKDNETLNKIKKGAKAADSINDGFKKTVSDGDISATNISDQISKQAAEFKKGFFDENTFTGKTTTEKRTEGDAEITIETTTKADGTSSVKKTTKKGGKTTVETT